MERESGRRIKITRRVIVMKDSILMIKGQGMGFLSGKQECIMKGSILRIIDMDLERFIGQMERFIKGILFTLGYLYFYIFCREWEKGL